MFNMVTSVKTLTAAVAALNKEFAGVAKTVKALSTSGPAAVKSLQAIKKLGGSLNLGSSDPIMTNPASFTDTTQDTNRVRNSLASSEVQRENSAQTKMPFFQTKMGSRIVAGGQIALGVAGAAYAALPDLGTTVSRAANYYGASVMGGINQNRLRQATFSGLKGGITGLGDDAVAAATLIQGYRYSPNDIAYTMRMREVGGAARLLNISNPVAAQALGGLGTGDMAGRLAQYGFFTSDIKTGKDLPFQDLAKQIYNRAYGGMQNVTREKVLTDARSGFLRRDLINLGFDETQQELLINAFGNFAEGKPFDLANASSANNPMAAQYKITTSQTALMERATDPMIKGFERTAEIVEDLNKKMEGLPDKFFELKASLQAFSANPLGDAVKILIGSITTAIATLSGAKAFRTLMGAGKDAVTNVADDVAKGAKSTGGLLSRVGTFASSFASRLTSLPLMLLPMPANMIPGTPGYNGPDVTGQNVPPGTMNGGTTGFGASFGPRGGGAAQSPVPGVSPTANYGAKDNSGIWSKTNNTHKGQDYPMAEGSDVQAAMEGLVFDDAPGYEYGITVQIDHGNGYQTLYGHLSKALVKPGERVKKGQVIGKSGATGNVTGPHLHFEVRKGSNNPVDPQELLNAPFSGAASLASYSEFAGTSSPASSSSASATSTGKMGTEQQQAWAKSFLSRIGAPQSDANIKALNTWMRAEGTGWSTSLNRATYNPLNTTLDMPGAVSFNKVGVKAYTSEEQGMVATINTLTGRNAKDRGYTTIIDALKADSGVSAVLSAVNNSAWRTGEVGGKGAYSSFSGQGGGRTGFGASIPSSSSGTVVERNVNITLNINQASEEEAIKFAKTVKYYLEKENSLEMSGSR